MSRGRVLVAALIVTVAIACGIRGARHVASAPELPARPPVEGPDPPEVIVGERLFLETRFAQHFFSESSGDVNAALPRGEPVLERTVTLAGSLRGPFAGASMNCRACHLVDEHAGPGRTGSRSYADFAARSPVPRRGEDDVRTTVRNSQALVGALIPRAAMLLHHDGEFATAEDLVRETMLGRNYGWLPDERDLAIGQVARVIRGDDGAAPLARAHGGAYRTVFAGVDPELPDSVRLPERFRLDVTNAPDERIVDAVAALVAAYLESLVFDADSSGAHRGSPYDAFLAQNGLPRAPRPGEADSLYSQRLLAAIDRLAAPRFVEPRDSLALHPQAFAFGPLELAGLKTFLRRPARAPGPQSKGGAGACASCHPAPHFTDFAFHNTGASQRDYDAVHGEGAFARLAVPDLEARNADAARWLPPSAGQPRGRGPFRAIPDSAHPERADLGLWNTCANPALPASQPALRALLAPGQAKVTPPELLRRALARFKTPSLRDLGHSDPYFHGGSAPTIESVLAHYLDFSARARRGAVRNADAQLAHIDLHAGDLAALAAFLRSLNEDYE